MSCQIGYIFAKRKFLLYNFFMKEFLPKCDLHLHSNISDGDFSVQYVLDRQKGLGIDVVALTDHDTVDGVALAKEYGSQIGLQVLAGVELSTMGDREVHILGYNVDYRNKGFVKELKRLRDLREIRNKKMIAKLNQLGLKITMEDVKFFATGTTTGRSHIAKVLVQKGYCNSVNHAFEEYLGFGKKAYVKEERISPQEGVKLIKRFGGKAVLAHPYSLDLNFEQADLFVSQLAQAGLAGIESDYFSHTSDDKEKYGRLAEKYGLFKTGGSDFHREPIEDNRPKYVTLSPVGYQELKIEV